MATSTPHLGLISNTSTDTFELSDFTNNWNALDASPGLFVCTSMSRPSWGTKQAGMMIVETDTYRQLLWTGTAWQEPLLAPGSWIMSLNVGQTLPPQANTNYTIGTINVLRPSAISVMAITQGACTPSASQWVNTNPLVDGANIVSSNGAGYMQWGSYNLANSTWDHRQSIAIGTFAATPGSHTLGANITLGSGSTSVNIGSVLIVALMIAGYGGSVTS